MELKENFKTWLRNQKIGVVNNLDTTILFKFFIEDYLDDDPAFFREISGYVLKLLIAIAEHGNDYKGLQFDEKECMVVGECIADIQNWCGENTELLEKFNLKYNA
jgi:hypothetical protein